MSNQVQILKIHLRSNYSRRGWVRISTESKQRLASTAESKKGERWGSQQT